MAVDVIVLLFDISGQDAQGPPLLDEIIGVQRSVPEEGLTDDVRVNLFLFKIMFDVTQYFALLETIPMGLLSLDQTGHF